MKFRNSWMLLLLATACGTVITPTPTPTATPTLIPTEISDESLNEQLDALIADANEQLTALEDLINLMSAQTGGVTEGIRSGFDIQIKGDVNATFPPASAQWTPVYALTNVPLEYTQITFFSEESEFMVTLVLPPDISSGTYSLTRQFTLSDQPAARGELLSANRGFVRYDTNVSGTMQIESLDEQAISGNFEFAADAPGVDMIGTAIAPQSITITGTFSNVPFMER